MLSKCDRGVVSPRECIGGADDLRRMQSKHSPLKTAKGGAASLCVVVHTWGESERYDVVVLPREFSGEFKSSPSGAWPTTNRTISSAPMDSSGVYGLNQCAPIQHGSEGLPS